VDEALAANPDLTAARAAHAAAAAIPATERYLMPPMIEAQVFQWPLNTVNPSNAQLMFTLQQEFPGRGKRGLRVARAETEASLAESEVAVRRRSLVADVKQAYIELSVARRVLRIFETADVLVRQLGAAAELKYATGRVPQQDVVKALVERTRLQREAIMASEQARLAEARLNSLLGRAADAPLGPLESPAPGRAAGALPLLDVVQSIARQRRPELEVPRIQARVAAADEAIAESGRRPDFIVQGGYMVMPDETNAWTGRVGITWPAAPWAAGRIEAERRAAIARREGARANERAVANQVAQQVQEAWVRARAAEERTALIRGGLLPQSEHALELARLAYQSDRASFLDVMDTARMMLDVQRDLLQAEGDCQLALVALERAVGEDLTDTLVAGAGE
jgi:cobalt-zinc-cadmium efflux system outer membrane protein